MVMLLRAPRMASIIAGKISSPLWKAWTRLPPRIAGPSRTDISRLNCGFATPCRCSTLRSIFFSGVAKFIATTAATMVATIVNAMIQLMRRLRESECQGYGAACRGPAKEGRGVGHPPLAPWRSVPARGEPLLQRNAQPDVGGLVLVVDQALAVAVEQLQAAAHRQRLVDREAPIELQRAARTVAAAQRMPGHQRKLV